MREGCAQVGKVLFVLGVGSLGVDLLQFLLTTWPILPSDTFHNCVYIMTR
jgi:hypothetical protein